VLGRGKPREAYRVRLASFIESSRPSGSFISVMRLPDISWDQPRVCAAHNYSISGVPCIWHSGIPIFLGLPCPCDKRPLPSCPLSSFNNPLMWSSVLGGKDEWDYNLPRACTLTHDHSSSPPFAPCVSLPEYLVGDTLPSWTLDKACFWCAETVTVCVQISKKKFTWSQIRASCDMMMMGRTVLDPVRRSFSPSREVVGEEPS